MHEDVKKLQELYDQMSAMRDYAYAMFQDVGKLVKGKKLDNPDLVDAGFLLRECEEKLDDWRKDCKAYKTLVGKYLALAVMQDPNNVNDATAEATVKGELASATPDLKSFAEIPHYGSEDFINLMADLGISGEAVDRGLVKVDWKRMKDEVTRRDQEGVPLPSGLGKKYHEYRCTWRRKPRRQTGESV